LRAYPLLKTKNDSGIPFEMVDPPHPLEKSLDPLLVYLWYNLRNEFNFLTYLRV
jgi:hypothetical protein